MSDAESLVNQADIVELGTMLAEWFNSLITLYPEQDVFLTLGYKASKNGLVVLSSGRLRPYEMRHNGECGGVYCEDLDEQIPVGVQSRPFYFG